MISTVCSNFINVSSSQVFQTTAALIVGTGSVYSLDAAPQWQSYVERRSSLQFEKTPGLPSHIDIRTAKEHLINIRSILNPSMSDLAALLDVSRQAIYKWLALESSPESDKLDIIKSLSHVADRFRGIGISRAGILLHMKNAKGLSLFDLIRDKMPYEIQVRLLIEEAKAMEASYDRSGLAQSKAESTNDWMSSISIPAYPEEF